MAGARGRRATGEGILEDRPATHLVSERRHAFDGRVWDVVTETVELPGGEAVTRDFVAHPGAVAVVAYRDPGEILLVRQYRHPVGRDLWELPAGLLDVVGEDPLAAAARELFEEADAEAGTWHVLVDFFTSPGGSSEAIRVYLARDVTAVPDAGRFDRVAEERDIEARWVAVDDVLEAIAAGRVHSPTLLVGAYAVDAARRSAWTTLRGADSPWDRAPGYSAG